MTKFDGRKVTIYFTNSIGLGIGSMEARLYEVGVKQYAQYDNAGYFAFKKKGARKMRGMIATYRPWMVALDGWGLPEFDNWTAPVDGDAVVTQSGKFSSCDERWEQHGDMFIADVMSQTGAELVAEFRHTRGFNPHDRFTPAVGG